MVNKSSSEDWANNLPKNKSEIETNILEIPGNCKEDGTFQKIDISFLEKKHFYIPDYQRGYRWLDEARFFIKDINENKLKEYLFQPLVVKRIDKCEYKQLMKYGGKLPEIKDGIVTDNELYELIDGQQRLTTLFLVLFECKEDPGFSLYYENVREIDNLYMKLSQDKIKKELRGIQIKDFVKRLRDTGKFVWYDDKTKRLPEDVFKSLNSDKTELTSSELFKALLLHSGNDEEKNNLISYQLDAMENELNDEDLWRFVSDNQAPANRVELIFDVFAYKLNEVLKNCNNYENIKQYHDIAKRLNGSNTIDSKYAFLSFDNFLSALKDSNTLGYSKLNEYRPYISDNQTWWEEIYDIFEIIKSWHSDSKMHNLVGFLLAEKGLSYSNRVKLLCKLIKMQDECDYDKFRKSVLSMIKEKVLEDEDKNRIHISPNPSDFQLDTIGYSGKKKTKCYDILLLANVWYAYKGNVPFNFKCLKDKYNVTKERKQMWDIEHINAQTGNNKLLEIQDPIKDYINEDGSRTRGDGKTYICHPQTIISELGNMKDSIEDLANQKLVEDLINKLDNKSCVCPDIVLNKKVDEIWKTHVSGKLVDNSISNLTLLSSDINRSYHNDFYEEKCLIIQRKDEQGWFIPAVTKNIFSSRKYTDEHIWNEEAQKKYRAELIQIIDEIWKEK